MRPHTRPHALFVVLVVAASLAAACDDDGGTELPDDTAVSADGEDTAPPDEDTATGDAVGDTRPDEDTTTAQDTTSQDVTDETTTPQDTTDADDDVDPDAGDTADSTDATDMADMADMVTGPGFDCVCDRTLTADENHVDLSGEAPGSVICLAPGDDGMTRRRLTLTGMAGTEQAPIVITSCDQVVTLHNDAMSSALSLSGSYFRVTGAGLEGVEYGLRVGSPNGPQGISVGRADHYEIDHVEIYASDFAGIMAKVDPGRDDCTQNDRRFDPWVMEGVDIHHNWIHDVTGEGIYLGNSFYNGATAYCGNNASCDWSTCDAAGYAVRVQYPHPVRQVRVHHNLIENTGWDGIQVGSADTDCVIHDNVVRNFATAERPSHENGIQTGGGSSCDVLRNHVETGTIGLHLSGLGDAVVANNVFVDLSMRGIGANPKAACGQADQNPCDALVQPFTSPAGVDGLRGPVEILHNTIALRPDAEFALRRYGNERFPGEEVFLNNFMVSDQDDWEGDRSDGWDKQGNVAVKTLAEAGFVDDTTWDVHLTSASPAVDAGIDLASRGITDDFEGTARPQGVGFDAGADELE